MHTGTRNFQAKQAPVSAPSGECPIPPKVSLRQVRDHAYGAVVTDRDAHGRNVVALYDRIRAEAELLVHRRAGSGQELGGQDFARHVSGRIALLLGEAGLDLSAYQARGGAPNEYGKYLLFSSLSLDNPLLRNGAFCIQLFCFEPGQATSIHNHPCECASLVLEGEIREKQYIPSCPGLAQKTATHLRRAGDRSELEVAQDNFPHSLNNHRTERCITVHVYAIDGISAQQTCAVRDVFMQNSLDN